MRSAARPVRVSTSYLPREKYVLSVTPGIVQNEKTLTKNSSLDSGVYGLRDSPNSANRESPNYVGDLKQNPAPIRPCTVDSPRTTTKQDSACHQLPEYIVDPKTRTTYLKGKFLGKGGFARVHELIDLTTNQVFAGKIIPRSRIAKPHNREKIAREIDLHRTLCHRHVVGFERYFEDSDNVYIILEYCPRKSLVHLLKHRSTLDECEVRYYMRQLAEACDYIHGQSIVHRDLKLGNMFISGEAQVKVGDFGLATRLHDEKKPTICGTPNYIAPEVLDKLGHGFEADSWAMGCIMYAMLVGQPPFETNTLNETYRRIRANQYSLPAHLSAPAADLITRLLDPVPVRRPSPRVMLQHPFFTGAGSADVFKDNYVASTGHVDATKSVLSPNTSHSPRTPLSTTSTPLYNHHNHHVHHSNLQPNHCVQSPSHQYVHNQGSHHHHHHHHRRQSSYTTSDRPISSTKTPPSSSSSSSSAVTDIGAAGDRANVLQECHQVAPQALSPLSPSNSNNNNSSNSSVFRRFSTPSCLKSKDRDAPLSLRQKLSSVFRSPYSSPASVIVEKRRDKVSPLTTLCTALSDCIRYMPTDLASDPACVSQYPLFITKWIDYSNKYGFGYQLSDRSVGVLFNDATKVLCHNGCSRVEFVGRHGKLCLYAPGSVPPLLLERYTLLRYFGQYMEENLTEGGRTEGVTAEERGAPVGAAVTGSDCKVEGSGGTECDGQAHAHMCRWLRTESAIVMLLSNNTVQVNFFNDHTKLVLWSASTTKSPSPTSSSDSNCHNIMVTYINSERFPATYRLADLASTGCSRAVYDRLQYASKTLHQFTQ